MNEERKSDLKQTEDRQPCLKHHMAGNFNRCTQSTYLEICVYGGKQKNMSHRIYSISMRAIMLSSLQ